MNILVFSDIHGSSQGVELLKKAILLRNPSLIIGVGDYEVIYSEELISLIKQNAYRTVLVSGNCDYPPRDEELLNMILPYSQEVKFGERLIHISHKSPFINFPEGDIVCYGHSHIKELKKENGVFYLNPGSISLPRDDCPSYGLILDDSICLFNAENNELIKTEKIL